jgi:hypothetical protein
VQLRRHRVPVAAVGHQRLRRHHPGHGEHGRVRARHRCQWLGLGHGRDGGAPISGGAHPHVAAGGAPRVQQRLRLLDGGVVRYGPPEPLRGNMVGLLHDAFAVPPPRWARLDRHAVVLRNARERGADLARARGDHRGHPVKAPVLRQAPQGSGDPVQGVDEVGLVHRLAQHPTPATGVREGADEQVRGLAPPPVLGRVGQLDPVPLGLLPGRVLDHRHRPALGRPARLARRA